MLLLPIAFAGNTHDGWRAAWVPALIVIGTIFLLLLVYYDSRIASKPVIPPRFVKNVSLVPTFVIGLLDAFAYSITHTYLYAWATMVHDLTPRDATFLTYAAGCVQVFVGWARASSCTDPSGTIAASDWDYHSTDRIWFHDAPSGCEQLGGKVFVMQVIQGAGSGMVGTVVIVVAQVVVPRAELAQSTALELLFLYIGNSMGSSIAGTIYTSLFKKILRFSMRPGTPRSVNDSVYDTITEFVPQPERANALPSIMPTRTSRGI